ncbi:MAG: hypothetical protein H8E70_03145 [Candidatus Marinimicrobia bacterium]|nr:hypothetical protein [Candidatus Neomarinimicrobiota bacterium]
MTRYMKIVTITFILIIPFKQTFAEVFRKNVVVIDSLTDIELGAYPNQVTDVWGYVDETTGLEYSLVCFTDGPNGGGVSIVDINEPYPLINDIAIIHSNHALDVKSYSDPLTGDIYAYIANGTEGDIMIYNISNPYNPQIEGLITVGVDTLEQLYNAHNLFIDGDVLYVAAVDNYPDQEPYPEEIDLFIYNLKNTPQQPAFVDKWNGPDNVSYIGNRNSVHDLFVRDNRIYMACGGEGFIIGDFDATYNTLGELTNWELSKNNSYQFTYRNVRDPYISPGPDFLATHSIWPSDDGNTIFVCDEYNTWHPDLENQGSILRIFSIGDPIGYNNLNNWPPYTSLIPDAYYQVEENQITGTIGSGNLPSNQIDPPTSIHNIMVKDNLVYIAYKTKGLRIIDASDLNQIIEVGFYDTPAESESNNDSASGRGSTGIYSKLPSGNILLSDKDGFRLIKPTFIRKGSITAAEE